MSKNNYITAYLYYATHSEEESDYANDTTPCIYDYICEIEETPLDCASVEQLAEDLGYSPVLRTTNGEAA